MVQLNLEGLKCPLPLIRLEKFLRSMDFSESVEIRTTDENAVLDFAVYCDLHGHEILKSEYLDGVTTTVIKKQGKNPPNSL